MLRKIKKIIIFNSAGVNFAFLNSPILALLDNLKHDRHSIERFDSGNQIPEWSRPSNLCPK